MFDDYPKRWVCTGCSEEYVLPPAMNGEELACSCDSDLTHVGYATNWTFCVRGKQDPVVLDLSREDSTIPSLGRRVRSAQQQEELYSRIINNYRLQAKAKRRSRHRRKEGECEMIGSVPRELFQARQNQYGKNCWSDDPEGMLKREGLHFDA